jgi:hypothetical protein
MMHQLLINLCDRLRRVESAPAAVE